MRVAHTPEQHAAGQRRLNIVRETELRARLLARDERALADLVHQMTPWLMGVSQSILRDVSDAEEVVLDSFRVAWDRIGLVDDPDLDLASWLLRITRNRAIDRLRSRRRLLSAVTRADSAGVLADGVVNAVEPNEAAQPGWHVHGMVHAAVEALPEEQRTALRLAFYHGLTQSEIATQLGAPLGTIKTRLRLAFSKLRVTLAPLKGWTL